VVATVSVDVPGGPTQGEATSRGASWAVIYLRTFSATEVLKLFMAVIVTVEVAEAPAPTDAGASAVAAMVKSSAVLGCVYFATNASPVPPAVVCRAATVGKSVESSACRRRRC